MSTTAALVEGHYIMTYSTPTGRRAGCQCGAEFTGTDRDKEHALHLLAVRAAEVAERIARALEGEQRHARAAHQSADVDHFAHDYCRWVGHAEALGNAARIAREAGRA